MFVGYGPALQTKDPNQMISWLSGLAASGGDDEPELSMHGLHLAAGAVRPSSTCYVYTDASAKDLDLYPFVKTVALGKDVKVCQGRSIKSRITFVLTFL